MKFRPEYKWFKISYLEFFFWKYYFVHATFLYSSTRSRHIIKIFLNFSSSSRKSQSLQKLAKKIIHFTIQIRSINLTHFMNLNLPDIENHMLPQHSQKLSSLYKFSSKHFPVWCQKKHLHCTISDAQEQHSWSI